MTREPADKPGSVIASGEPGATGSHSSGRGVAPAL